MRAGAKLFLERLAAAVGVEIQQAYRELDVGESFTQDEIKARYRKLVLELHPDRSGAQTGERLGRVTEAYHTLMESSSHRAAAREQREAQGARNASRQTPHAQRRGMAGRADSEPPTEDWSRFTSEFEADESFWKEYERNFWQDYERRRADTSGEPAEQSTGGDAQGQDAEPAQQPTARTRAVPRMDVNIDKSLCIGCCSCETIAPSVFCVDKESQVNPKSSVTDPLGADAETIMDAAETCPTKAIIVNDMARRRRIYPL